MANNYTQSSFEITGESADLDVFMALAEAIGEFIEFAGCDDFAAWRADQDEEGAGYEDTIFEAVEEHAGPASVFAEYGSLGFDCSRESDESIWVHDDGESINVNVVIEVIQIWMDLCDIDTTVSFTWACTCSKPRIGEFDGGGVVITKSAAHWVNATTYTYDAAAGILLPPVSMQLASMYDKTGWTTQTNLSLMDEFISEDPALRSRFANFITRKANEEEES